mmetsp:Transcript_8216/g.23345  ORF Transcript_8216/g.23345 Transcript_8216/m.23345 type:complete len:299 (+) Transcript_8216:3567-4463(+)
MLLMTRSAHMAAQNAQLRATAASDVFASLRPLDARPTLGAQPAATLDGRKVLRHTCGIDLELLARQRLVMGCPAFLAEDALADIAPEYGFGVFVLEAVDLRTISRQAHAEARVAVGVDVVLRRGLEEALDLLSVAFERSADLWQTDGLAAAVMVAHDRQLALFGLLNLIGKAFLVICVSTEEAQSRFLLFDLTQTNRALRQRHACPLTTRKKARRRRSVIGSFLVHPHQQILDGSHLGLLAKDAKARLPPLRPASRQEDDLDAVLLLQVLQMRDVGLGSRLSPRLPGRGTRLHSAWAE